jgi:outer membrane protein TolC
MNEKPASLPIPVRPWLLGTACLLAAALPAFGQAASPEPLTLRKAAELALEQAPQLAAVRAAREEGAFAAKVAADTLHPSVWLTTTPGYSTGLPVAIAGQVPAYGGIEVRQTIYNLWKKNDELQAQANAAGLEGKLGSSCADTVQAVVTAYARTWADGRRTAAARRRLEAAEAEARRVEALYGEGRRTELDLERAKLQAARAKQKLLNAESDRDLDALELKRLIGWPGNAPLQLAGATGAIPDVTSTDNLGAARAADPQLKALGREVELLGKSASLSSKRWPIIEASAKYQRLPSYYEKYYNSFNENDFSFGVAIAIPLFSGGSLRDTEARAKAGVERARAEREARESDIELAVRRAEAAVAQADAEQSLARRSEGIAEQDLTAAEILLREGRGLPDDVDERQIALSDANEEAARAELSAMLERAKLLALRGDLAKVLLGAEPPCAVP